MIRSTPWSARAAVLAAMAVVAAGCGQDSPQLPTYPVTGSVLVGGRPADRADVVFRRVDAAEAGQPVSVGRTTSDGSFRLSTFAADDGAPAGKYAVTVVWPVYEENALGEEVRGADRLKGRFGDARKPELHVDIEARDNRLPPFDLDAH